MEDRFALYRETGRKAVRYQLGYQQPDGGYIWEGYARDAFHKQAYSWSLAGEFEAAHRLLTWVQRDRLGEDGQLKEYHGDVYKHAWFLHGAHRLGRFDLSYPVMSFLLSCQAPCGGFPLFAGEPRLRALSTFWTGIAALYFGRLDVARRIAECAVSMMEQQPDPSRFYYCLTLDGQLITPDLDPNAPHIDTGKPKQDYWEVGLPMQLLCRLYQATGEGQYLDLAQQLFEFKLRCYEDAFTFAGSGKSAYGSALLYLLTGDRRAREAACRFADHLVATQYPEGGWRDELEPDLLLIYIDHAAEFNIWLQELSALIPAADLRWAAET